MWFVCFVVGPQDYDLLKGVQLVVPVTRCDVGFMLFCLGCWGRSAAQLLSCSIRDTETRFASLLLARRGWALLRCREIGKIVLQ